MSASALYERKNSQTWTSWGTPAGKTLSQYPSAVSWDPSRVDVFVRNTSNTISHAYSDNPPYLTAWDDWGPAPLTYSYTYDPGVASWGKLRLDLFQPVTQSDSIRMLHRRWDDGTDYGWTDIGVPLSGRISTGPSAVSWAPDRIDAFVNNGSNSLGHAYSTDGINFSWDTWTPPAGYSLNGQTSVASWGNLRLDVFVLDMNGTLDHVYWDNGSTGWDNWGEPSSGNIVEYPAVTALGDQRLLVEVIGQGGTVYQRKWVAGSDTGWVSTGTEPATGQTSVAAAF